MTTVGSLYRAFDTWPACFGYSSDSGIGVVILRDPRPPGRLPPVRWPPFALRREDGQTISHHHCFSEAHRSPDSYLLQANYCSYDEYAAREESPSSYASELAGLTGIL